MRASACVFTFPNTPFSAASSSQKSPGAWVEGCLMSDHIHRCIKYGGRQRNFTGENFWARGYYVSTVGLDEAMVRAYIRNQEVEDERYDQMKLME